MQNDIIKRQPQVQPRPVATNGPVVQRNTTPVSDVKLPEPNASSTQDGNQPVNKTADTIEHPNSTQSLQAPHENKLGTPVGVISTAIIICLCLVAVAIYSTMVGV